jgi:transcriptional regulator with XRE-family HTH domain
MESLGAALETSGHTSDTASTDLEMPSSPIAEAREAQPLFAKDHWALQSGLVRPAANLRDCPPSFSELLRILRYEAGLTLQQVAIAVGVSKPTVWSWENGKAKPGREKWHAIANALGVPPDLIASAATKSALAKVVALDSGARGDDRAELIAQGRSMIAKAYNVRTSAVRIFVEV